MAPPDSPLARLPATANSDQYPRMAYSPCLLHTLCVLRYCLQPAIPSDSSHQVGQTGLGFPGNLTVVSVSVHTTLQTRAGRVASTEDHIRLQLLRQTRCDLRYKDRTRSPLLTMLGKRREETRSYSYQIYVITYNHLLRKYE